MNPFIIAFRRIIYSIPLKRLLVGLAVFSVLFASISSADYLDGFEYITTINNTNGNLFNESISTLGLPNSNGLVCFKINSFGGTNRIVVSFNTQNNFRFISESSFLTTLFGCFNYAQQVNNAFIVGNENGVGINFNMDIYFLKSDFSITNGNPGFTSFQCQTEYNLIPISSVDQNYCTTNNLCPTYDCPTNPIGTGSLSNLYINNILHIGAPNIIMNIPEEIDWDYAYTMGGNTMNIDIVGYNQNYEEIEDWIYTNNYKPSSDDFTKIFTNFSNFGGLLIATLFVILVFYFVKKMFK